MNIRNLIFVLLLLASGTSHSESDGNNAEIPYAVFYNLAKSQFIETDLKSNSFSIVFASTRSDVKAQNIKVYINAKAGKIPLQLNSDGLCLFPIRSDLLEENPYIVSNQPKGTMQITASINYKFSGNPENIVVDVTDNLNLRYIDIFRARQVFKEMLNNFSEALKEYSDRLNETTAWIEFRSAKLAMSPVVIHSNSGDIRINPDEDGVIRIKYEPKLSEENPIVSFPDRGKIIVRSSNKNSPGE